QSTNAPQSAQTPAPTSLSGADVHAPAGPRLPASTAQGLGDSTKLGLGDGAETKKADKATECEENIRLCKQELQRFADGLWKTRKKDWQAKIKPLEDKRQEINECAEAMLKVIQTFGDSICKYEKDYHPVAVAMGVLQGGRDAKDQKGGIKGRWELLQKDLAQLVSPTEPSLPEPPPHVVSLGEEEGKRVLREWQSSAEEQFKKKAADALPDAETANLLDTYKYLRYDCAYEMIAQIEGLKGIKAAGAPGQGLSAWCNADANGLIQRIEEVSELEPISPGPGDNLDLKLHDRSSGTGDRIKECIKKGYRKPGGESSGVFRKAEVVTHN
ncbi:MAG: hypothetical protein NT049_00735, partial [Planctomycetota bacterium]|nr:hypothetical protein [Planctomycetota bacterium]